MLKTLLAFLGLLAIIAIAEGMKNQPTPNINIFWPFEVVLCIFIFVANGVPFIHQLVPARTQRPTRGRCSATPPASIVVSA